MAETPILGTKIFAAQPIVIVGGLVLHRDSYRLDMAKMSTSAVLSVLEHARTPKRVIELFREWKALPDDVPLPELYVQVKVTMPRAIADGVYVTEWVDLKVTKCVWLEKAEQVGDAGAVTAGSTPETE